MAKHSLNCILFTINNNIILNDLFHDINIVLKLSQDDTSILYIPAVDSVGKSVGMEVRFLAKVVEVVGDSSVLIGDSTASYVGHTQLGHVVVFVKLSFAVLFICVSVTGISSNNCSSIFVPKK